MYVADRRQLIGERMWIGRPSDHAFDRDTWRSDYSWCAYTEATSLPADPGVYIVVTYDDLPIYVGSSYVSIRQRWAAHHRRDAFETLGADRIAYMTCSEPDDHYLYGLELRIMSILLPILNDRSDNAVGIEFFDGRRRLVPLTEEVGAGWLTRWKRKPSVGRPRRAEPPADR